MIEIPKDLFVEIMFAFGACYIAVLIGVVFLVARMGATYENQIDGR